MRKGMLIIGLMSSGMLFAGHLKNSANVLKTLSTLNTPRTSFDESNYSHLLQQKRFYQEERKPYNLKEFQKSSEKLVVPVNTLAALGYGYLAIKYGDVGSPTSLFENSQFLGILAALRGGTALAALTDNPAFRIPLAGANMVAGGVAGLASMVGLFDATFAITYPKDHNLTASLNVVRKCLGEAGLSAISAPGLFARKTITKNPLKRLVPSAKEGFEKGLQLTSNGLKSLADLLEIKVRIDFIVPQKDTSLKETGEQKQKNSI